MRELRRKSAAREKSRRTPSRLFQNKVGSRSEVTVANILNRGRLHTQNVGQKRQKLGKFSQRNQGHRAEVIRIGCHRGETCPGYGGGSLVGILPPGSSTSSQAKRLERLSPTHMDWDPHVPLWCVNAFSNSTKKKLYNQFKLYDNYIILINKIMKFFSHYFNYSIF